MRRAMDLIHFVVKDGVLENSNERNERTVSRQVRQGEIIKHCVLLMNELDSCNLIYAFAT